MVRNVLLCGTAIAFIVLPGCQTVRKALDRGGTVYIVQVTPDVGAGEQLENARRVLGLRLNAAGFAADVAPVENSADRLEVKVYGTDQPPALKNLLTTTHKLEIKPVVSPPHPSPLKTYPAKDGVPFGDDEEILPYPHADAVRAAFVVVKRAAVVTGADIRDASPQGGSINFSLKQDGAGRLREWTSRNIGNYVAIVLDGEVKSAAYIRGEISDSGMIDGRFTPAEAEEIALTLRSGYLPAKIAIVEERKF